MDNHNYKWILASDIDGTLTGDRKALDRLREELSRLRETGQLFLVLSTGRHLGQVIDGFENEGIPVPDAVVSQVGTEIYLPPFTERSRPLQVWNDLLTLDFDREEALALTGEIKGMRLQPEEFNTELKLSFFVESEDPEGTVKELSRRIRESGDGRSQIIWSSGKDLDIIPAAAGKGKAISFLFNSRNIRGETVIVAGDSGNDKTMFEEFSNGIIVANAQPELKSFRQEHSLPGIYQAEKEYAAGVAEGLRHFGLLPGESK
jgi:sucrose-6F-phosphate phosphohydrolase